MMRIQKSLISSILFGSFVWLAVMAVAQAQTPTVQIKHVRVLGDTVRVEWSTQTPADVTVVGFVVDAQIGFIDGAKAVLSENAGPTANSIALKFTPRNIPPSVGLTKITTRFTAPTPTTVTTTRDFALNTVGFQGGIASGGEQPADRPVVQISGAVEDAVDARPSRFTVKWVASVPAVIRIDSYEVRGLVTYGFKQPPPHPPEERKTDTASVDGAQRQANLVVNDAPDGGHAQSIRVTVTAHFHRITQAPTVRIVETQASGTF